VASEPALFPIEHHQVVAADVPTGERTHLLRHDDCFGLFNEIGDIDAETRSEAGLYRCGVRHLSRLTLTIAGLRPLLLAATPRDDNVLLAISLTNPDIRGDGGSVILPCGTLHIRRSRFIWQGVCHELIRVRNFALSNV
jgi:glycogen debranching enzyme